MFFFLQLYRFIFTRPFFYRLNWHFYKLSLRGIGVLNAEGDYATGERFFLQFLQNSTRIKTVVDAGANTGSYSQLVTEFFPKAQIFACEPHPNTFQKMKKNCAQLSTIKPINVALGSKKGTLQLWDFADDAELKSTQPTSTLSSLHPRVITELHGQKGQSYTVHIDTVDNLAKKNKLKKVDLIKIDTEGHELEVLKGSLKTLAANPQVIIQLEFNEMSVYSRYFLKDIYQLLPNHHFYRLLPHGLFPLGEYRPLNWEIFGFQNVVALPPVVSKKLSSYN